HPALSAGARTLLARDGPRGWKRGPTRRDVWLGGDQIERGSPWLGPEPRHFGRRPAHRERCSGRRHSGDEGPIVGVRCPEERQLGSWTNRPGRGPYVLARHEVVERRRP